MENLNKLTNGKGPNKDIFLSMVKKMDDKLHLRYNLPVSLECSDSNINELYVTTMYGNTVGTKDSTTYRTNFILNIQYEDLKELALQNKIVTVVNYFNGNPPRTFVKLSWVKPEKKVSLLTEGLYGLDNSGSTVFKFEKKDSTGEAYYEDNLSDYIFYAHVFLPSDNPEKLFDFNKEEFSTIWDSVITIGQLGLIESETLGNITLLEGSTSDAQCNLGEELVNIHFVNSGKSMLYFDTDETIIMQLIKSMK